MRFGSYNLNKELVDALTTLGYVEATPIQEKVLAKALKGKSLICKSETGSGKTHAFLIPILKKIIHNFLHLYQISIFLQLGILMNNYHLY